MNGHLLLKMKIILNRGYKQVPILAGKNINIKPKTTNISATLTTGLMHSTMNQAFTYIMVKVKNATSKGFSEVRVGGVLNLSFPDSKTRRGRVIDGGDTSPTLDTDCEVGVIQVGQIYGTDVEPNPQAGRIYSDEGLSPTLDSMRGGQQTAEDYLQALSYP